MDLRSSRYKAWVLALGVHLFALIPLFWLEHSKPFLQPPPPKPIINATIFGQLPKAAKPTPAPEPKKAETPKTQAPKPKPASKPKASEDKSKQLAEQKLAEEKAIRIKQEEEKKRLEEKRKAEEQKKLEEQKRLEEQKKLEEQKRLEEEKKLEEEKEAKRQSQIKEKQEQIQRKLQEAAKQLAASDAQVARETDRLKAELIEVISDQWSRPLGIDKKLSVVIELVILSSGELSGVKVLQSSGNAAFDRSAVQAARLASPFTMFLKYSPEVRSASRTTVIKFTPDDLFN